MKIEKINENQIRCTLSKADLSERHLKISELAAGTDKAKDLLRDMMEQANIDFGFEADDIPLMIEAIPTSRDSIVLVITKVDSPEDFEEKFGHFGLREEDLEDEDDIEDSDFNQDISESEETQKPYQDFLDLLRQDFDDSSDTKFIPLHQAIQKKDKKKNKDHGKKKKVEDLRDQTRVFSFDSMNPIIHIAHTVSPSYKGKNTLWKNEAGKRYFLLINRGSSKQEFRSTCANLSEYGKEEYVTYATEAYFNEHYTLIIKDKALAQLSQL
ncbi:MAG: adaptor protein MecA [Eubacterium sp.]|nr:adaptor protein MecA [Eubacterium sp.]